MKLHAVGLLSLALAVCLGSAMVAQEEGRGRGRGGAGGPGAGGPGAGGPGGRGGFPGMMGGGSMGGALDLVGLLRMEQVQKELEMTPEAAQAVRDAMPDMRELFNASESERAGKLKEASVKAQEVMDEVLSPEHQKRLLGLYVQQNNFRAASNELVAKEIGLDEAGVAKVKEAAAKAFADLRGKMEEMRSSGNMDFTKMREMMEGAGKDSEKAIQEVLTDDQEKALEALKGEKFEFPERPAFGGGRGGPGGDRGDRGDRGGRGRPGSDNN
jgi:hypothetical protein